MEKLNKIFRTEDVAKIDAYSIEREQIKSIDLMERAACIWTDFFLEKNSFFKKIVVIAGWGNNGGDGFAIARLLKAKDFDVTVYHLITSASASVDCKANMIRYVECGGVLKRIEHIADLKIPSEALIVDAIFGAGLNRKVEGLAKEVIGKVNSLPNPVVAVDIPSGLFGEDNTGNDGSGIIKADYTFTFQFPKLSFMLPENYPYVGEWHVLDIGLCTDFPGAESDFYFLTERKIAALLPKAGKFAHKGINGKGLLVAGSSGMMGAAILAAKAAVRSSIGLLACRVPEAEKHIIQISVPEALIHVTDLKQGTLTGYEAVAIGPGIGKNPDSVEMVRQLLLMWRGVTILDADALNILAEHPQLLDLLHEKCILTPHMKEFERLAGKSKNDFERLNKLSTFVKKYRIYLILKGAHTVVAPPSGECYFNMTGNPGMAKGGMGDVLTGVLLGLTANGNDLLKNLLIGVYTHGLAADIAVKDVGERGLCAGIVAEGMGKAWKGLESIPKYDVVCCRK